MRMIIKSALNGLQSTDYIRGVAQGAHRFSCLAGRGVCIFLGIGTNIASLPIYTSYASWFKDMQQAKGRGGNQFEHGFAGHLGTLQHSIDRESPWTHVLHVIMRSGELGSITTCVNPRRQSVGDRLRFIA